jgi:hypothetical protein
MTTKKTRYLANKVVATRQSADRIIEASAYVVLRRHRSQPDVISRKKAKNIRNSCFFLIFLLFMVELL